MKLSKSNIVLLMILAIALLFFCMVNADQEGFMSLSNNFSGQGKCLDSGPTGAIMAPCGQYSGQQWSTSPSKLVSQNPALAGKCLDLNGGSPIMAGCAPTPAQLWTFLPNKRIQNSDPSSKGKCLEIVNDPYRNKLQMNTCSKFAGQIWTTGLN
jgi:hypothetical protein